MLQYNIVCNLDTVFAESQSCDGPALAPTFFPVAPSHPSLAC